VRVDWVLFWLWWQGAVMDGGEVEAFVGYSIFETSEECWQYNE